MNEAVVKARAEVANKHLASNQSLIERSAEGVTPEASLIRVGSEGNNFNWLVGHIVASRNGLVTAIGGDSVVPQEIVRKYQRSAPLPVGEETPLSELVELSKRTAQAVSDALARVEPARLEEPSPLDMNLLEYVEFLVWHDTYHTGQAAVYRRMLGLEGVIG